MKFKEMLSIVFIIGMVMLFAVTGILCIVWMYNDYHTYSTLKKECNQEKNKDLCFCYNGDCEVEYKCKGESNQIITETINGEVVNSSQNKIEGTCKDYERRLCEIATVANDKEWMWRYCI